MVFYSEMVLRGLQEAAQDWRAAVKANQPSLDSLFPFVLYARPRLCVMAHSLLALASTGFRLLYPYWALLVLLCLLFSSSLALLGMILRGTGRTGLGNLFAAAVYTRTVTLGPSREHVRGVRGGFGGCLCLCLLRIMYVIPHVVLLI